MATKTSSLSPSTRTCLCSPTTHPGSFRCSFHRSFGRVPTKPAAERPHVNRAESKNSGKITMMVAPPSASSKTRMIKAFLMQIIKPSSQDVQRRRNFQPRPTRFCPLNSAASGVAVS